MMMVLGRVVSCPDSWAGATGKIVIIGEIPGNDFYRKKKRSGKF
jgi:hypothetical protein